MPAEHLVKRVNTRKMRKAGLDVDVNGHSDCDQATRVTLCGVAEGGTNGANVSRKTGIP